MIAKHHDLKRVERFSYLGRRESCIHNSFLLLDPPHFRPLGPL
jgi:hypothetical protein